MDKNLKKRDIRRKRREKSVRRRVRGTEEKPRLSVIRSNKHLFAQLIDDENFVTIAGVGTVGKKSPFGKKSKEAARQIGAKIAQMAKEKKIQKAVFDRGHYKFHGLIAEIAAGAREAGLHV